MKYLKVIEAAYAAGKRARQELVNQGGDEIDSVLFGTIVSLCFRLGWADAEDEE